MILIIITDGSLSSLKTAAVQDSLKQSLQSICPDDNELILKGKEPHLRDF